MLRFAQHDNAGPCPASLPLKQRREKMANTTQEFFQEIAARGSDPALRDITGTCRFDIVGVGTWYLAINKGALTVTQQDAGADLVITCDAQDFDRIVRGEEHPVVAGLRGRLTP